jgi:hypothetical protein
MIDLIKCSLYFSTKLFPNIDIYELTDNSMIDCDKNIKISLADLQYIKYGKTWYEKEFNAKVDEFKLKNINLLKQIINNNLNEPLNFSTKDFLDKFYKYDNKRIIKKVIKIYKKNILLKNFLNYFFTNNLGCIYYYNVFNTFIGKKLFQQDWIIMKNDIDKYDINIHIEKTSKLKQNSNLEKIQNKLDKIELDNNNCALFKNVI